MQAITNSRFFRENNLIANETVLINNGKIVAFTDGTIPDGYAVVDAKDNFLVPGFIDLQIYGSGGNLFSAYPTVATLKQMDEDLTSKGTTGFLACIATNTAAVVNEAIIAAKTYRSEAKGFLGLHLEGPYLNAKRRGAHIAELVRKATLDEIKALLDHADGVVKMMTIAPELQDDAAINYLIDNGIVISLGHSDATYEEAVSAYNQGIQSTTHLFNAMNSIHHRAPGIPSAVFNHNYAMASIIADGNHVNFEVIKFAKKLLKDRLFLISDAVTACEIGPYQHRLEGDKFITADGTLSGSNITLLESVKNCVKYCEIDLNAAIDMVSSIPAKLIKINGSKGAILRDYDADLLLLDADLNLKRVFKA